MMGRLVAAEWLKLRTTRVLWGTVPAVVLLSAVSVAGLALSSEGTAVPLLEPTEGVRNAALHLTSTGAVLVMVLGIIISAGEYRTQTATDTFLTTPRRSRVLAAKLVIAAIVGLALGTIGTAVGLPLAYVWFEAEGTAFPGGDAEVWLTLAGVVLYAVLFAILGVAFGSLVRNQVVAIVSALTFVLLIEQVLAQSAESVGKWFPGNAGAALVRAPGELLDPGSGAALLLAYALAIAVAGMTVTAHRDA
jgi:ABC-type transport system involved in multi-copper enzyme maturation permease subunit